MVSVVLHASPQCKTAAVQKYLCCSHARTITRQSSAHICGNRSATAEAHQQVTTATQDATFNIHFWVPCEWAKQSPPNHACCYIFLLLVPYFHTHIDSYIIKAKQGVTWNARPSLEARPACPRCARGDTMPALRNPQGGYESSLFDSGRSEGLKAALHHLRQGAHWKPAVSRSFPFRAMG